MAETATKQGIVTIGIDVKVNDVSMNYVTDIGDIGGSKSELDNTCLKDTTKKSVFGLKELNSWECTYLYDNTAATSDYRVLKALEDAGNIVPVEVEFPDGTVFKNEGIVNNTITGAKVDSLIEAKLEIALQKDWVVTNPA